jgi:hypothetical protein
MLALCPAVPVLLGVICVSIAARRGCSPLLWTLGVLFFLISLIVLLVFLSRSTTARAAVGGLR